ncbi:PLP-dependent aminotransferase family protein [Thalassobius sp. Cn5-15]|uniref:MocR-like pyridoxine biosynthesis transcription factor PdxR n=1 Tax=Thalassobius sp. Cn5-15 TaxID=2917763 RepID=UPI001EF27A08|nr:PLP-dependent aminotransferase family protein [Thalassobius sp. Cn5-15]
MVQLVKAEYRAHRIGRREICANLRDQIRGGNYAPDEPIPSSRALAEEIGVSRTTVSAAYDQLAAEGYIVVCHGMRPRVAVNFPAASTKKTDSAEKADPATESLSAYGRRLIDIGQLRPPRSSPDLINFRYGEIASEDFPTAQWRRAVTGVLLRKQNVLSYHEPFGSNALRHALQSYLWRARSINCSLDQIIIVNGSQQALDLLSRILLDPGDTFAIENPSYAMARWSFEASGATAIPIEVDDHGLVTDQLEGLQARLAYVTPSHQYPMGGVMPIDRRMQLVDWAKRSDAWIVEDDYDSEYRYDVKPLPPLWASNPNDRVIYIGTVSKTLSPALRIGYAVVPNTLVSVVATAKQLADRHNAQLEQEALADLIQSGTYERHVRRQRRKNNHRRETLISALKATFGDRVDIRGTEAGLHIVVWFRDIPIAREPDLIDRARTLGVGLYSVRPLCNPPLSHSQNEQIGLVMGYASLNPAWIVKGVSLLDKAIQDLGL